MNTANRQELPAKYRWVARLFEVLPGLTSWGFLATPIVLSFTYPVAAAYVIIGYDLLWSTRFIGFGVRLVRGYSRMHRIDRVNWSKRLGDLDDINTAVARVNKELKKQKFGLGPRLELKNYRDYLTQVQLAQTDVLNPAQIFHGVIIAIYNEPQEIVEETVKSVLKAAHVLKNIWLVIAYEERGGAATERIAQGLVKRYGKKFSYARAIKHPADTPGEIKAKAGNITLAARHLRAHAKAQKIDPEHVLITTLDSDNRPSRNYFSYLTLIYATTPERTKRSYQPMAMFFNNIWQASAPMRLVASANSFWVMIESTRPHRLRNFSAHAQSLRTLIDTDYWNVRSIVEDGHQFWRTFYRYGGNHSVIPLYVPVYQDVVYAGGFWRSVKAQFKQLRRWAYGASDISYIFVNNLRHKEIPWAEKWWMFLRHYEGYFSWATASLILAFAAWLPLWLNTSFADQTLAHQLPVIVSRIHQFTAVGILISAGVSFFSMPRRPVHYPRYRLIGMVAQWLLLPVVFISFHSAAALNAQTRLMIGAYLEQFDVTEKARSKIKAKSK